MGKYLRAGSANSEKDQETGDDSIWVLATNIGWKDVITGLGLLRDLRKSELATDPDGTKMRESKIGEEIRRNALDIRARLNPSTTRNYGAGAPPDKDHLKK